MTYKTEFSVAAYPPSLNGKGGLLRQHWSARRKHLEEWMNLIWYALSSEDRATFEDHQYKTCEIRFSRFTTHHTGLDWDNFGASFKIIGDALVELGILVDDSPKIVHHIDLRQAIKQKADSFAGIEVVIEGELQRYDKTEFVQALQQKKGRRRE